MINIPPASPPPPNFAWIMTSEEKEKYENIFYRADENKDNFVTGEEVIHLDFESKVAVYVLSFWSVLITLNRPESCLQDPAYPGLIWVKYGLFQM